MDEINIYHNYISKVKHIVEQKINNIYLETIRILKDQIAIQENYIFGLII